MEMPDCISIKISSTDCEKETVVPKVGLRGCTVWWSDKRNRWHNVKAAGGFFLCAGNKSYNPWATSWLLKKMKKTSKAFICCMNLWWGYFHFEWNYVKIRGWNRFPQYNIITKLKSRYDVIAIWNILAIIDLVISYLFSTANDVPKEKLS